MNNAKRPEAPTVGAARIQARTTVTPSGCWRWDGSTDVNGYGYITVGSRTDGTRRKAKTHRALYEALVGPIPAGLDIDHLCRNRACCNPAHLEPVSRRENLRRGVGLIGEQLSRDCCAHGHLYTEENTYLDGTARVCRACKAAQQRARRARAAQS